MPEEDIAIEGTFGAAGAVGCEIAFFVADGAEEQPVGVIDHKRYSRRYQ